MEAPYTFVIFDLDTGNALTSFPESQADAALEALNAFADEFDHRREQFGLVAFAKDGETLFSTYPGEKLEQGSSLVP